MAEEIYIFDIDGCIMPPIISNFNDDDDKSREKTVNEIVDNGSKIKLYTEFVKYYKKNCRKAEIVVFITGRKKSEFGKLTESQLKLLDNIKGYRIIYYPERKKHESSEYFKWKIKEIQALINKKGKNQYNNYNNKLFFKIFDDMADYFPNIKDIYEVSGVKVQFYSINGKNSWDSLNN